MHTEITPCITYVTYAILNQVPLIYALLRLTAVSYAQFNLTSYWKERDVLLSGDSSEGQNLMAGCNSRENVVFDTICSFIV